MPNEPELTPGHIKAFTESSIHLEQPGGFYRQFTQTMEKPMLETVMLHFNGNKMKAAEWLGINRATLKTRLERYGIQQKGESA